MRFYSFIFITLFSYGFALAQQDSITLRPPPVDSVAGTQSPQDSLINLVIQHPELIDSLKLRIKAIVVSGNKITKDEIILREMIMQQGEIFTVQAMQQSILNIYNLRLFYKVDIIPIPVSKKEIVLNVDVKERWYIFPLPQAGLENGEWKRLWIGLNLIWNNVRGRNETLFFQFRALYNPSVRGFYTVPWIGENLHMSVTAGAGYEKIRNQSLVAVNIRNGSNTLLYNDSGNFDNIKFNTNFILAKHFGRSVSFFTDFSYNYVRVTQYGVGRTLSPTGKDRYLGIDLGFMFDSRNLFEYTTKGYFLKTDYIRYGYIDNSINYGKFDIEARSFIPINISKTFFITIASRLFTSLSIGTIIPYYNHAYLGYGDDYVRGWARNGFEGNDKLTLYNEIRIPILTPRYINASKLPILKSVPYLNKMDLKHGLYFTIIYDLGNVWYNDEKIRNVKFMSGAGIGLNAVFPFGYVGRLEWVFPIAHHPQGQVVLTLNSKF